jgi:hypothetical protein
VLGGMLIEPSAVSRVFEFVEPEDFYREAHRIVFEAIIALFQKNEPIDLITVTNQLSIQASWKRSAGPATLPVSSTGSDGGQHHVLRQDCPREGDIATSHRRCYRDRRKRLRRRW